MNQYSGIGVRSNLDYFIPLDLKIIPAERELFERDFLPELKDNISKRNIGLSSLGILNRIFPETIEQTNKFLSPIGIKTDTLTIFGSAKNNTSWNIHCDGTMWNGEIVKSEARLSYYEIAEAPGIIRWWDHLETEIDYGMNNSFTDNPDKIKRLHQFSIRAKIAKLLKNNLMDWSNVPPAAFESETSCISGLLRTDIPHHVIQGPGTRITVGCQLSFLDGNPIGVWQHIRNNLNKLGLM